MDTTTDDDMKQKLVHEFSRIIRSWLTTNELGRVLHRNKRNAASTCATHDFCDANEAMAEAFQNVTRRASSPASEADAGLWSAAWDIAKRNQFSIAAPLIVCVDGISLESSPANVIADIRRVYPTMHAWSIAGHHGGALRLQCDGGTYLLITERGDTQIPPDDAKQVDARCFAANGDRFEEVNAISIESLHAWITAARSRARDPQNVGDYFVLKLGEGPGIPGLHAVPILSPGGQNCMDAIDAAAHLRGQICSVVGNRAKSASRGQIYDPLVVSIVEIARQVIAVQWRFSQMSEI